MLQESFLNSRAAPLLIITALFFSGCAATTDRLSADKSNVIALVNGREITFGQLNSRIAALPRSSGIDPDTTLGKRAVLDTLINEELLYQEAEKTGIPERKAIKEAVKAQADQIILNQLIYEKFGKRLDIADDEVKTYYENNKQGFLKPEERRVRHIVLKDEETAREARKKLVDGAEFAKLVEEYSPDEWKKNSGDLGYIERARIIPEFANAAFGLEINELSEPVKTNLGYHIIEVMDIKEAEQIPFEEVKDLIKRSLIAQKREALVDNWVSELRAQSDISIKGSHIAQSRGYRMETLGIQPEPSPTKQTPEEGITDEGDQIDVSPH